MGVIVTITEQSGNDLFDYPIRVEITDPQFFEECPDQKYIECYFQDGSWIPHWVEEFDPANNKAVIWVKVPQIPANGTVKVFIKVNPSRTEDLSDGEAVFDFFDDFEDGVIDTTKWTVQSGNWVEEGGVIKTDGTGSGSAFLLTNNTFMNVKIITKLMMVSGTYRRAGIVCNWINSSDHRFAQIRDNEDDIVIWQYNPSTGAHEALASASFTSQTNVWYRSMVIVTPDSIKVFVDDIQYIDKTGLSLAEGRVGLQAPASGVSQFDWFLVAKYIDPEPTVSVEYVSETVTYSDYFYWGMAKMLSGAIANLMQLPIKMEIYSGSNLLKTLSLKEISTITDAENKYIISVLKFEDDSSDSYQTDKQIVYVTDPNGNLRKLAESTYVFIKMAELPLLLGFEIRVPYEDTQVELS